MAVVAATNDGLNIAVIARPATALRSELTAGNHTTLAAVGSARVAGGPRRRTSARHTPALPAPSSSPHGRAVGQPERRFATPASASTAGASPSSSTNDATAIAVRGRLDAPKGPRRARQYSRARNCRGMETREPMTDGTRATPPFTSTRPNGSTAGRPANSVTPPKAATVTDPSARSATGRSRCSSDYSARSSTRPSRTSSSPPTRACGKHMRLAVEKPVRTFLEIDELADLRNFLSAPGRI